MLISSGCDHNSGRVLLKLEHEALYIPKNLGSFPIPTYRTRLPGLMSAVAPLQEAEVTKH